MYTPVTVARVINIDAQEKQVSLPAAQNASVNVNYSLVAPVVNAPTVLGQAIDAVEPVFTIDIQGYGPQSDKLLLDRNYFKYYSDSTLLSDIVARSLSKTISESLAIVEIVSKGPSSPEDDVATVTDSYAAVISYNLSFVDTTALSELLTRSFGKAPSDATAIAETVFPLINIELRLNDQTAILEVVAKNYSDEIVEIVDAGDLYNVPTGRVLSDTSTTSEVFARVANYSRSPIDDTALTEALQRDYSDTIEESTAIVDLPAKAFSMAELEATSLSEVFAKSYADSAIDLTTIVESISIDLFSYMDYSYTSEIYVVTSTNM
jgi:hypothetical protein